MKLRWELTFKCRDCGTFIKKNINGIVESTDCPKCHRLSDFIEGTARKIQEYKRVIPKNQKKLEVEI
jgi:Zn finger protein HypA/HybF involved in hydrogenase expression